MKIDVIIPKGPSTPEKMLQEALESVQVQSIDTVCHVIRNEESPAYGRNKGLEEATNRYVAYLDADDLWAKNKLQKQVDKMEKTNAGVCIQAKPPLDRQQFLIDLFIGHYSSITSSILIDTSKVGVEWEESLARKEDHLYLLEVVNQGGVCGCKEIIDVRKHEKGLTAQGDRELVIDADLRYIKLAAERVPVVRPYVEQELSQVWFRKGRHQHFNGDYRKAIRSFIRSSKRDVGILHPVVILMSMLHACSPTHPQEGDGDILNRLSQMYKKYTGQTL